MSGTPTNHWFFSPLLARKQRRRTRRAASTLALACLICAVTGCHGDGPKKNHFFTSGSREADQRASQEIAKAEQLAGSPDQASAPKTGAVQPQPGQVDGKLTLYDRLGGGPGISNIVADFVPRVLQDPRVNWSRQGVKRSRFFGSDAARAWTETPENVRKLKKHLAQFLSLATGGPPEYDGQNIQAAHRDMLITNPEFDAVIGDLKASLDKLQVANREQKELLAIAESTRPQVVSKR